MRQGPPNFTSTTDQQITTFVELFQTNEMLQPVVNQRNQLMSHISTPLNNSHNHTTWIKLVQNVPY